MDWICLASTSHRCSIGLRSGDPKEAKSTPQSRCCAPQTIPEPFLLCCMVRYPAERGHSHQGIGQNQSQQNIAQSITLPPTSMPSSHSASCAMCSPGKQHTSTRPSTWCKRKRESSDRANFFHCSVVQFWCSQAHFQQWTGVSMGTLTGLWLCSPIHNKRLCTVYSDTFLSEPAFTSAIWATVAHLLARNHMGQPSLPTCIDKPWLPMTLSPFHHCCSFDHFW